MAQARLKLAETPDGLSTVTGLALPSTAGNAADKADPLSKPMAAPIKNRSRVSSVLRTSSHDIGSLAEVHKFTAKNNILSKLTEQRLNKTLQ